MVLQLVMDMAGTFPILGYLLIKKIFKKHMTAQKYIWILRLSIILYLCPFQEFKYLILPEKLLERFNFADFWGIAGKKISGFEVVNIPSLFGDYYVTPRGIFLVTVIWFIICTILVIYYYGTYFFIKRQIRKNGIKTDFFSGKRGKDIEVFQTAKVKTPCTVDGFTRIFLSRKEIIQLKRRSGFSDMRLHMFGMGILSGRRLHFLFAFFIGIIHLCIIFFNNIQ